MAPRPTPGRESGISACNIHACWNTAAAAGGPRLGSLPLRLRRSPRPGPDPTLASPSLTACTPHGHSTRPLPLSLCPSLFLSPSSLSPFSFSLPLYLLSLSLSVSFSLSISSLSPFLSLPLSRSLISLFYMVDSLWSSPPCPILHIFYIHTSTHILYMSIRVHRSTILHVYLYTLT